MNPHKNHTDTQLIAALLEGEKKAFEIIYKTYAVELYKYARHIISDKEDCEEIVQDVFERLWSQHKNNPDKSASCLFVQKCKE